jgi:Lon protease-like protein
MPLRLHIFEDRYKQMIRECLDANQPFGVALIRRGEEAFGPAAEPYSIGCMARILQTEPLSQGRMNLVALGQERFRIHSIDSQSAPYLIGKVEPFPLANPGSPAAAELGERLRPLVEQYMHILEGHIELHFKPENLPAQADSLAYVAAILLQSPAVVKQELLSIPDTEDLISSVSSAYRRELPLLKNVLLDGGSRKIGAFSEN